MPNDMLERHTEAQRNRAPETFLRGDQHPSFGVPRSEETRQRISASQQGKVLSKEHRENISKASSGEKNGFFGKQHSEESKRKISEAGLGRKDSKETREKRRKSLSGRVTSSESKLRSSFTKHIRNHIEKTPKRKYTCRWCNGDTLENAIEEAK
jgi:hypothetical protein